MARVVYGGRTYVLQPGETVLEGLVRGGAELAFSCGRGTCHTCLLRAREGDPGEAGRRGLRPELVASGHFLPCISLPERDLVVEPAMPGAAFIEAIVARSQRVAPGVLRLELEPELKLDWRPGQFVNVRRPDGVSRPYSISSIGEEDWFLTLHVREESGGEVSGWIHRDLVEGGTVDLQGPMGTCCYREEWRHLDLLLVGTGVGVPPLYGLARDAVRSGHCGRIRLVAGAGTRAGLVGHEELERWGAAGAGLAYVACVTGEEPPAGGHRGRVHEQAFGGELDASRTVVVLCGHPDMVYEARVHAVAAGVPRRCIVADPFVSVNPTVPGDEAKLARSEADPEMWEALGRGSLLRDILEDFYGRVYEDDLLAPFFHNVTKERAVSKQYAFLRDIYSGTRDYFGLKPFNAHHWMVISDELFDYREELMESVIRAHGLPERLVRRWNAFHELFRREIVKPQARGLRMGGVEVLHEGYSMERMDVGTLCDGCSRAIETGEMCRMHRRTGQLYCLACEGQEAVQLPTG